MTHSLTTIEVQGQQEQVYEVYADESREQTIGYTLEEKTAVFLQSRNDILAALELAADRLDLNNGEGEEDEFISQISEAIAKARGEE